MLKSVYVRNLIKRSVTNYDILPTTAKVNEDDSDGEEAVPDED